MAKFTTTKADYTKIEVKGKRIEIIKKRKFDTFNASVLGLGELGQPSKSIRAISVMFDLEGFTDFCRQIDPQLGVPEYLDEFLDWLFAQIRKELIDTEHEEGYETYSELPFLAKFMGDGVLFLWDVENLDEPGILNIIVSIMEICAKYESEFYPLVSKKVVSPPSKLRCGVARGTIYSIGDSNDYVGPCINMSARLQKLHSLSLCFSRRGLNPESSPTLDKYFKTMKVDIRGIGSGELVCVLKKEYENASEADQSKFTEV